MTARLVEMRIRGLRTLADVTLPLGGLTVLIGDNGTGKSSLLEALRIAQLIGRGQAMDHLVREHMLASAVRHDATELNFDFRIEAEGRNLVYSVSFDREVRAFLYEAIHELAPTANIRSAAIATANPAPLVIREPERFRIAQTGRQQSVAQPLSLFDYFGAAPDVEVVALVRAALEGTDVHLPFAVTSGWAARASGQSSALRDPRVVEPTTRLELFGNNLANVYHTLKNSGSQRWRDTLELLQLGFGPDLLDVQTPTPGGGHLSLAVEYARLGRVPAFQLADGQLSYLAFVALVQLDPGRTLLAFDEPEQHLHPGLLSRVLELLEDATSRYPVVIATHSDRLLDFLLDPVAAVVVCEVDAQHRTVLRHLDSAQLGKWMQRYSGVGDIRAAGQLRSIVAFDEDTAA